MTKLFIGVDPGLTGAVGAITSTGRYFDCFDMPTVEKESKAKAGTKAKVKRKVDGFDLHKMLMQMVDLDVSEVVLVLEAQSAMPPAKTGEKQRSMGSASLMSLGHTYGMIEATIQIAGIKYSVVHPRTLKNFYKIPGEKDGGKKVALSVARMLFRNAPLKLQKHHNRAEALLLARYGFDTYVGESE